MRHCVSVSESDSSWCMGSADTPQVEDRLIDIFNFVSARLYIQNRERCSVLSGSLFQVEEANLQ
jgi:hypothetical protein